MPESKLLYLLRHAKSSWDDPAMDDHDRPLAARGRKAAAIMRAHLIAERIEPELVLCSSARRTIDTLEGVAPTGEHLIEPGLYGAGVWALIERLHAVPDTIGSVMLIGHNPAMQSLVLRLAGSDRRTPEDSPLAEVEHKFPTAALATISLAGSWRDLSPGTGELVAFVRPKALRNGAVY